MSSTGRAPSPTFSISTTECDEYDGVVEEAVQVSLTRARPVLVSIMAPRSPSKQAAQCPRKPGLGRQLEGPAQAGPEKNVDKIADEGTYFEIRKSGGWADHPQGNPHDNNTTTNPLPSQIGPFTFEQVPSAPVAEFSKLDLSAPSLVPYPAQHLSTSHHPASMPAEGNPVDSRPNFGTKTQDHAAIVAERARHKQERVETWITDVHTENFAYPDTSLAVPTSRRENETSSRQQHPELEESGPPHYPFLDDPMDPTYSRIPVSRTGSGRNHPLGIADKAAIRGNFIPISKSLRTRAPSPSREREREREQESRDVYLQLSLTDSQMNRLTEVLNHEDDELPALRGRRAPQYTPKQVGSENEIPQSSGRTKSPSKTNPFAEKSLRARSRSPVKFWTSSRKQTATPQAEPPAETPSRQRSRSPVKFWSNSKSQNSRHVAYDLELDTPPFSVNKQPGHRGLTKTATSPMVSPPSALRRAEQDHASKMANEVSRDYIPASPTPARRSRSKGPAVTQRPGEISPLSPTFRPNLQYVPSDTSSVYSQDIQVGFVPPQPSRISVSPLRIRKEDVPKHVSVLQGYKEWLNTPCVAEPDSDGSHLGRLQKARGSDLANNGSLSGAEPQYSVLSPFTPVHPEGQRMASKTLIGHNGWLDNTSQNVETKAVPTRKPGFLDNLVKKAKETFQTGDGARVQRKSRDSDKSQPGNSRNLAISLNPREQSLVYCELEYALTTALNDYLMGEFNAGRIEADKVKKVSEMWHQRGRPKVVSFRYDLETQLELVKLHVNDFKFYGPTVNPTAIIGVLDMMKVDARVLRIRTFCQPDTVIAKQLLDSQNLFNILGCPDHQQIQLAEITDFFKAAMERERLYAGRDEQQAPAAPLRRSKSNSADGKGQQHQSSSTHHKSNSSQHKSYGTHHTQGTQHQSHGTQGSQHQSHGTTHNQVRRPDSRAGMKMDPAELDSDDECF